MGATTGRVLVVDDEPNARDALAELLADEGHDTRAAADGAEALELLEDYDPDVVLTDLKMPGVDGIELIERGRTLAPHAAFIVMTAFGTVETAVAAIKRGAENYLTKPLDMDTVSALVGRAMSRAQLSREAARLREQVDTRLSIGGVVGSHPSMQRLLKMVEQVARSRASVLIEGETGTGKELVAAAIHHASPRRDGPFVRLNCAAIPSGLVESELFGHEKGAFTGAVGSKPGRFELADGGTLFLDEVGEMGAATQVKLLRFLQEREFERVGGAETLRVDVRVVAATNRDLRRAVDEGHLREDLYYRLNVVRLEVPPLRARRSDVPALAHHFLRKHAEANGFEVQGFTDEALRALIAYPWPGNVRELENAVEHAVVLCEGRTIGLDALPELGRGRDDSGRHPGPADGLDARVPGLTLAEIERVAIERTLDAVGGSTAKAAELLGISQRKVQYRVKEWSEP